MTTTEEAIDHAASGHFAPCFVNAAAFIAWMDDHRVEVLIEEARAMQDESMRLNNAWIGGPDQEWHEIQRQCRALDDAADQILNRLRNPAKSL